MLQKLWGAIVAMSVICTASPAGAPQQNVPTLRVSVSAYCLRGRTASGLRVRTGIAAADPDVLPMGSVIRIRATGRATAYDGVYTILDTGGGIKGHRIDLHISNCAQAKRFGRRSMVAEVLRRGSPDQDTPQQESPARPPTPP